MRRFAYRVLDTVLAPGGVDARRAATRQYDVRFDADPASLPNFMKEKRLLFSVTAKDCDWDTMTAGGKGGQHQNRKRTAVRCTHKASGAVGEARDSREQIDNRRAAFKRMSETKKFQNWLRVEAARRMGQRSPEEIVDDLMHPSNLRVEYRTEKGWEQHNVTTETSPDKCER